MGIFSRLTDIVNSNINSILDRAEEPEKIIRLIVQEMEDTLVEVRATAARTIADKKEIARRLDRFAKTQAEWQRKAELALSKGREDLAKSALLEKTKLNDRAEALATEYELVEQSLDRGEADITKLEAKLREAKTKQKTILARSASTGAQLRVRRQLYDGRVDDALSRFDQIEKKLDEAEAEVESFDLGRGKSLSEEIDELAASSAIEQELAALKAKLLAAKPESK
jgi:phage shock protein A